MEVSRLDYIRGAFSHQYRFKVEATLKKDEVPDTLSNWIYPMLADNKVTGS